MHASTVVASKEEYRWCVVAAVGEEFAEVGVGGDDDSAFAFGRRQDLGIRCLSQADIANVDGVMFGLVEQSGEKGRLILIEQGSHAGRRRGSSRSYTASAA